MIQTRAFLRSLPDWLAPHVGWVALYAFVWIWLLTGREAPEIFVAIVYFDVIVTLASPWILGALLLLFSLWMGRDAIRGARVVIGVLFVAGMGGLLLWACGAILHAHGGWPLVAAIPILALKVNWRAIASGRADSELGVLFGRGMLAPFACFAPALVISCLVFRRQTLGVEQGDWVGLFGVLYFSLQAVLDYFLLRRAQQVGCART